MYSTGNSGGSGPWSCDFGIAKVVTSVYSTDEDSRGRAAAGRVVKGDGSEPRFGVSSHEASIGMVERSMGCLRDWDWEEREGGSV